MDGAISIAVLHHISSRERRVNFIAEMSRVMRFGAVGLITVWASAQEDHKKLAKWEPIQEARPRCKGKTVCQAKYLQCCILLPNTFTAETLLKRVAGCLPC